MRAAARRFPTCFPRRSLRPGGEVSSRRNPAPVEVGSLSHYLHGFSTIPGGDRWISEPSAVSNIKCMFSRILQPGVAKFGQRGRVKEFLAICLGCVNTTQVEGAG